MTKTEINQLRLRFNLGMVKIGLNGLRRTFSIERRAYPVGDIKNFLEQQGFSNLSLSDLKYHIAPWVDWQKIINAEWVNEREYIADTFDCDNYSFYFAANVAYLFNLNSAGVAYGSIYEKDTGKYINRHAFNMIVAFLDGKLGLFAYEPKKDYSCQVIKGQPIIMGNWRYSPDWLLYF